MEFRVLGPVQVLVADRSVDVGHAKQRAVLAVLVLELNHVVAAERLIERVWGEDPPNSVRNVLYGYVARLRSALACDASVRLSRQAGGYVLEADEDGVDLIRFHRLVAKAGGADSDDATKSILQAALRMWRGDALAGLTGPWFAALRENLQRQKMAALLDLNDVRLRQRQHNQLIPELTEQVAAYPADERLIGQLMLALYRSGRQAESLRLFQEARQRLADELGANPGPELQLLHERILRNDASLPVPEPVNQTAPVPRQLPPDVSAFTGRTAELAELDQLIAGATGDNATAVVISAVSGTAGVGKTALAVHWAHSTAERFPDGQLYVNLRGYDPDDPVPADEALAGLLRALGVQIQDIPLDMDQRAAQYRSLLAGKAVLVLLDNAVEAGQVRPLLPPTRSCLTIVTSRDSLSGLVARDGARRLNLDLLPLGEAVELLQALIGRRVDDDPNAAEALATLCCRLPLALRVAAELAAVRPATSLSKLVDELTDQQRRLDLFETGGDPHTAVRSVFSWSYRQLDPDTARGFRLLGLRPGADFAVEDSAALLGIGIRGADRILSRLARGHLIDSAGTGRYTMHDLLREYARELAITSDSADERHQRLTDLIDYYVCTTAAAVDVLFPASAKDRSNLIEARVPGAAHIFPGEASARGWLDAERANLVAITAYATANGWPRNATQLATVAWPYLEVSSHFAELAEVCDRARDAARMVGDRTAEALALNNITVVDLRQGRYEQAAVKLKQALTLHREIGNKSGEAFALGNLGIASYLLGRYADATHYHEQALILKADQSDSLGEARTLINLSLIDLRQGRYDQAGERLEQALTMARELADPRCQAQALANLGVTRTRQRNYTDALKLLHESLTLFRARADPAGENYALANLGLVELALGNPEQATEYLELALSICRQTGEISGEAEALNGLGAVLLALGEPAQAAARHAASLEISGRSGDKYEQARAHYGLGCTAWAAGHSNEAKRSWQRAITLYHGLGAPEADQIRDRPISDVGGQPRTPKLLPGIVEASSREAASRVLGPEIQRWSKPGLTPEGGDEGTV